MQDEINVVRSLQRGVVAAIQQSDLPALPVRYLTGVDGTEDGFDIPQDQKWLEIVWIPNKRIGDYFGDEQNYRGILRLILHWPNAPTGVYTPLDLLASITRYFMKGMILSGTQVYANPQFTGSVDDKDDVMFPVSIYYTSYRKGVS